MTAWLKVVAIFIALSLPMRCFGEYKQEWDRDARVEQHVNSPIANLIPDCGRGHVQFNVGSDGIIRYWCGGG